MTPSAPSIDLVKSLNSQCSYLTSLGYTVAQIAFGEMRPPPLFLGGGVSIWVFGSGQFYLRAASRARVSRQSWALRTNSDIKRLNPLYVRVGVVWTKSMVRFARSFSM